MNKEQFKVHARQYRHGFIGPVSDTVAGTGYCFRGVWASRYQTKDILATRLGNAREMLAKHGTHGKDGARNFILRTRADRLASV